MRRVELRGRCTPNFESLSLGRIESRCPSNSPVAKNSIYFSKPARAAAIFRLLAGGCVAVNYRDEVF